MKNGSFDLAFRTMTIGLLMFLVLSIVSVGIHQVRPGSGNLSEVPTQQPGTPVQTAGISGQPDGDAESMRREFAASLSLVSDRLAGIEQQFAAIVPASAAQPEARQLQSAIESTQRRLEHLGDRLADRIHAVNVGREVELRDLNRQLSQLLDEQQQIQEEMLNVRMVAGNPAYAGSLALRPSAVLPNAPAEITSSDSQGRLLKNLEAMVSELASLREQLQSVRIAAADIPQDSPRSIVSRKIPQDRSAGLNSNAAETPLDRTVPDPADLDAPATGEPSPTRTPPGSEKALPQDSSAEPANRQSSRLPLNRMIELPESDQLDMDSMPVSERVESPAVSSVSEVPAGVPSASAQPESPPPGTAAALSDDAWQIPVAARPVSTIFPADTRPGSSTQIPREKSLPLSEESGNSPREESSASLETPSTRISLPAPEPPPAVAAARMTAAQDDAPRSVPVIRSDSEQPSTDQPTVDATAQPPLVTRQEPRRIGRDIPRNAQRAPLRLADGPVVRPFEIPTASGESSQARPEIASKPAGSASASERVALTSSDIREEGADSHRGVTNAKWRAARNRSANSSDRPALRDPRSLFPVFRSKSDDAAAKQTSSATDRQIPEPLPLPGNITGHATPYRVAAPPLIQQTGAATTDARRRFAVQATVLHVTADDMTTVDRAGIKTLAVMGGHDFRVNQIRHAVRESESTTEIYSGTIAVSGGVPARIPIGWLCPHCNEESGVASGDQLVITLPHGPSDNTAAFHVEQADGTGRAESFRDGQTVLIPGASVQITEMAQDGTIDASDPDSQPMLSRLPVIGEKFEKKKSRRQIMQRIIVLTVRELRQSAPAIQQVSGRKSPAESAVVHADLTAPATRPISQTTDSSRATAENRGVENRRPAPPIED